MKFSVQDLGATAPWSVCYDNGEGACKDAGQAVEWWWKAAELGHADAQNNLGVSYDNGEGVRKDADRAMEWY